MQQLAAWIFILGFLLMVVLVIFAVFYGWRQVGKLNQQRRQMQTQLGFTLLASASQAFESRIDALYKGLFHRQLKLDHVAHRRIPAGDQFIFTLLDTSSDSDTRLVDVGIAIVSPNLSLPRFSLHPRPQIDGLLGELAGRVVAWAASQGRKELDFSHHPEFAQRFLVTADDPAAIQAFLSPALLDQLACLDNISIEAGWDIFAVAHTSYPPRTELPDIDELRRWLALADHLYQLFSEPARQTAMQAASSPLPPLQCTQCGAHLPAPAPGASIVRCDYCGQELLLWLDKPPAPSRALPHPTPGAGSPSAAGLRTLNAGANLFGRLLFSVFLTLFAGFIVFITAAGYRDDRARYDLLTRQGQHVTAVITRLQMETDSDGDHRYYVHYRFSAQVNGKTRSIESLQRISRQEHDQFKEGQRVAIVYAASDPDTSDFASDVTPPGLTTYIVIGAIAGLFTLLGVFLFIYTVYRLKTMAQTWLSPKPAHRT